MKKILSLTLVFMLVIAMAIPAMATKYVATTSDKLGDLAITTTFSSTLGTADYYELEDYTVQTGDGKITIALAKSFFVDADGNTGSGANVTSADIRDSKLDITTNFKTGKNLVKSVSLDKKKGLIEIELYDSLRAVESKDYDFTVSIKLDKTKVASVQFVGTVENEVMDIDGDDRHVTLENGEIGEVNGFNKGVEIDIGLGTIIKTRLFDGRKFRAVATRDADESDLRVMEKYADVDNVVTIDSIGIVNSDAKVIFVNDNEDYFVYDKDMNYLGRGNEELKFSSKYYLANAKLDVVSDVDVEEPAEEDEIPGATGNVEGGGDEAPANINDNPGTGR